VASSLRIRRGLYRPRPAHRVPCPRQAAKDLSLARSLTASSNILLPCRVVCRPRGAQYLPRPNPSLFAALPAAPPRLRPAPSGFRMPVLLAQARDFQGGGESSTLASGERKWPSASHDAGSCGPRGQAPDLADSFFHLTDDIRLGSLLNKIGRPRLPATGHRPLRDHLFLLRARMPGAEGASAALVPAPAPGAHRINCGRAGVAAAARQTMYACFSSRGGCSEAPMPRALRGALSVSPVLLPPGPGRL